MDSAHPPPFSEHLRRAGTSHTMNHIITRVVLAFPTTQSDFPSDLLTAQGGSPFKSPCFLGSATPSSTTIHTQSQGRGNTPNNHAPTFESRHLSCWTVKGRGCPEP